MRFRLIPWFFSFCALALTACGPLPGTTDSGTPFVSVITETSGDGAGICETNMENNSLAQSFYLSSASTLSRVIVYLKLVGSFPSNSTHTLSMRIETNSSDAPSASLAGTGATASIDVVSVTSTSTTQYTFTLASPVSLSASTTYWIKITGSYGQSITNYIKWAGHDGSDLYASGHASYLNSSSNWSTVKLGAYRDFLFQLYP